MYQPIVRRLIERVFADLSRGDYAAVLPRMDPRVHHRFAGDHALGGDRHTRDGVEQWFARLFRLFSLQFTVTRVVVSGPPWNLVVPVEWVAEVTPVHGPRYLNRGVHIIHVRRGRVVELLAYEDSQAVVQGLAVLAEHGVDEATAAPILT
ncbi:nuclear transport factor 2 family protein [uncultured Jatrophihabitans sp.]|uniref:nuclear transport factor 2 family protein n=1 Tax=uncultured Jatrophihabitans sp. TaxID=1610747 RepID=UPI0035CA8403